MYASHYVQDRRYEARLALLEIARPIPQRDPLAHLLYEMPTETIPLIHHALLQLIEAS